MDGKAKQENIIAQFHIVDKPTAREQYLEDYHHCPLCGTELVYTHVANFVEETVKEDAHCMACNIRTKSNSHTLN